MTPHDKFRAMRIRAAAFQLDDWLKRDAHESQIRNWFSTFHDGEWRAVGEAIGLCAFGIDAIGDAGTGDRGAAAAWLNRVDSMYRNTPLLSTITAFLAVYGDQHLDTVAKALRENIEATGGIWMLPECTGRSPASHLLEIQYLGIPAQGHDELEVASNWMRIAKANQHGMQAA